MKGVRVAVGVVPGTGVAVAVGVSARPGAYLRIEPPEATAQPCAASKMSTILIGAI